MFELEIESLTCNTLTGDLGDDEIGIEMELTGEPAREPYALIDDFASAGDTWTIGYTARFDDAVTLRLWEIDDIGEFPGDVADKIGSDETVDPPPISTGSGTLTFANSDGGDYELAYTLTENQNGPAAGIERARASLADFKTSPVMTQAQRAAWVKAGGPSSSTMVEPSAWRSVPRTEIEDELTEVIGTPGSNKHEPAVIQQWLTGFCVPTTGVIAMAWRQPRRYIEMVRSLYQLGAFLGNSTLLQASSTLRNQKFARKSGRQALVHSKRPMVARDWVSIASLRDALNYVDSIQLDDVEQGGFTWEKKTMIEELLGFTDVDTVSQNTGVATLQQGAQINGSGGVTFLSIDDVLMGGPPGDNQLGNFVNGPDHSVLLFSTATPVTDGRVTFEVNDGGQRTSYTSLTSEVNDYLFDITKGVPP